MKRRDFIKLTGITTLGATLPISLDFSKPFPVLDTAVQEGVLHTIDLAPGIEYFMKDTLAKAYHTLPAAHGSILEYNYPLKKGEKAKYKNQNNYLEDEKGNGYLRYMSLCKYFGVRTNNLKKGCKKLAEIYVELDEKYGVKASLSKGVAIQLLDGSWACCMYLFFDADVEVESEFALAEGETPTAIDDNMPNLEELASKKTQEMLDKVQSLDIDLVEGT